MTFFMTLLSCGFAARGADPARTGWPTYLPLLASLSALIAYLLLLIFRKEADDIERPVATSALSARCMSPSSSQVDLRDLEAQVDSLSQQVFLTTTLPPTNLTTSEATSVRITSPARSDSSHHLGDISLRLAELSACAEHRELA